MDVKNKIPFRPIRCLEETLETLAPVEGHVVFTTDTGKIYACIDGEYKMMGGSSGIFYANKYLTDEEKYGDQIIFSFLHTDIDGKTLPGIDDLILNIPDGGFYRVLDVSDVDIRGQRIAISGSGSGGGGTGGGPSNEGSLIINYITPKESSTITGVDYYIEFEIVAKDSAGDLVSEEGNATWIINGKNYYQKVYNGKNSFKIDEYLDPTLDKNKFVLMVDMNTGGINNTTVSKTWYVKAVELRLEWDFEYDTNSFIDTETFQLSWYPYGGVNCTTHIVFDDLYVPGETYFTKEITPTQTGKLTYSDPIPALEYGSHKCEMYITAMVNGEEHRTPSIINEITFISGGNTTILTVPYYNTVATQYDTLKIPFMVYDPDLDVCDVGFYVNDIRVGGGSYNRNLQYWPYTLANYGSIKLTIKTDNDDAAKDIELLVNKIDLNVTEPSGAAFSLKANNFSSNDELIAWNSNTADNVTLEFSPDFDWENGGLRFEEKSDGSIEKFIRVRQGTWMKVKYKLFGKSLNSNGKNFKVNFKASNCYDYSASLLSCYDSASKVGIRLEAQQAIFSCDSFPNFTTQYFENSYIELETEIWPDVKDPDPENNLYGDRFIMFWIDGVPAGVKAYSRNENFQHLSGGQEIIIGSDLCDVDIYVMKAYERKLTEDEHLDNFILDAPSTEEMLKRYNRNDILDNVGEISYTKLIEKNPDCRAYMYDMERMTTGKDDKIGGCTYTELFGDYNSLDNPYYTAEGAEVYVQGTSSAAYGAAAFNLRTKFIEGLIDKEGNQVDGWKVTDTAMPIELPCTKVNVASCENVNNVVNQEWYNRYQPYHDAHRRKNDGNAYRDTMQFESGVVFVKDNNPKDTYLGTGKVEDKTSSYLQANCFLDTPGYVKKPYYKMYAIANMGNDKKNVEVFHDVENPKACCVEIADNQNAEHWMTVDIGMDQFDLKKPFHEFRYPDGNDEASAEQKQAWVDFVEWMAKSDPSPYEPTKHPYGYTGAELPQSVTFEPYTFRGFDPPGYEGEENPTGISLKGVKIERYAGTYTHDTRDYRIAKMLNECEDHLVMDSVVFHYLFIQRHTMVDNVAKNTFWSSEDLIHWDLTKDYDNDTSDGNNNSGYLTFSYGIENLDKTDDGADIFNASDSVWIQFIHDLTEAQEELHKELALKGAWDSYGYLNECLRHQNIIPERCWIYNYFHHYIRPRRLGLDENTFLNRLEGGKKTHQRKQYENYQEYYLNSKYLAGTAFTDSAAIDMRLNKKPTVNYIQCTEESTFSNLEIYYILNEDGEYEQVQGLTAEIFNENKTNYYVLEGSWNPDNALTVSFYTDCYPSIHIGGQIHRSPQRLKRGQTYDLPVGTMIQSANDSTCYLYGASMLQTLSGLAETYPSYVKLANAGKLREIAYGSDEAGYYNPNLTSLDIGSNAMLQKAQAQNSGQAAGIGSTDLSNAAQLKELLINGSTLKALALPEGGIVEILKLNALNKLSMINLTMLKTIELDEGIYNSETGMNNLTVKNCPAMDPYTYRMALEAPMTNYEITEFNWTITSIDGLEIENDKVIGIKVVDKLINKIANSGSKATSLIGNIHIDVECNIDEYDIYEKYCQIYPNLTFTYGEIEGLDSAVEIKFMSNDSADSSVHYRVLGSGAEDGESIEVLISAEGPTGLEMANPTKTDTSEHTYEFSGYWKNVANNQLYYRNGLESPDENTINFINVIPTENMVFVPVFIEEIRKHEVKFFDYYGNIILQNGEEVWPVAYNTTYVESEGPMVNYYYLDSSNLPTDQRYKFEGWTTAKFVVGEGNINKIDFIDLNTYKVKQALNLYPYYTTENVYETATSEEYFELSGSSIVLKNKYREVIAGKITLPEIDGITTVGSMSQAPGITHVFFLKDSKNYTTIGSGSFSDCSSLIEIVLPKSITKISSSAFARCYNLENINLDNITSIDQNAFLGQGTSMKVKVNELPVNLSSIGGGAFMNGGPNITITKIPDKITVLPSFTFFNCPNIKISEFGSNDGTGSQLTTIDSSCFNSCYYGGVTSITFKKSITFIGIGAFSEYSRNSLENVYFALNEDDYNESASNMGFKNNINVVYNYIE